MRLFVIALFWSALGFGHAGFVHDNSALVLIGAVLLGLWHGVLWNEIFALKNRKTQRFE